jgi:osomolarity two-component system, response regulator SSK1
MATNKHSKVWVCRTNSSPTRIRIPFSVSTPLLSPDVAPPSRNSPVGVDIQDDFLVDDLREAILHKYPQSFGKHHDAADLSLRIMSRTGLGRLLSPEENVLRVLREEYPDGQKSSEAWSVVTSGGRDNYSRWWLETGGVDVSGLSRGISPGYYVPNTAGSMGSEAIYQQQQEYFPHVPMTGITPPGEYPPRGRPLVVGRPGGRPPLRTGRTQDIFPVRRYEGNNTTSLGVEPTSASGTEQGRASPDTVRYGTAIRPGQIPQGRTPPPTEYPVRLRQYPQTNKTNLTPSSQGFQMQLPPTNVAPMPPKVPSPLSGPPQTRAPLPSRPQVATIPPLEKLSPQSPNPPASATISPATRRRGNTVTSLPGEDPTRTQTVAAPVQKQEKDNVPKKSSIGLIPPINVLIVEDNIINAQILQVFFKKRNLKHATAVNGKEAVEKWRQGGWHLVLVPHWADFD